MQTLKMAMLMKSSVKAGAVSRRSSVKVMAATKYDQELIQTAVRCLDCSGVWVARRAGIARVARVHVADGPWLFARCAPRNGARRARRASRFLWMHLSCAATLHRTDAGDRLP